MNKIFYPVDFACCQQHGTQHTHHSAPIGASPATSKEGPSIPTGNSNISTRGIDMTAELPFDPKAIKKTMPNGMTYIIRHHNHPTKDTACLRLVIRAGSIDEKEGQQGLAHFLEHLSFCRTEKYQRNDLIKFLEKAGAAWGADQNAHTGFNEIVYKFDIPIQDLNLLDQALDILREMTTKIVLTQETLDEERHVVLDEILNESDNDRLWKKKLAMILKGTPYAERFPKGLAEIVKNCKPEQIIEYYRRLYQPNNMGIAVVADCDPEKVEKLILKHFSDIPASTQPANEHHFTPEVCKEPQFLCFTDSESTKSSIAIMHSLPKSLFPKEATGHAYKTLIVRSLFNAMINRRYTEIATDRPNPPFTHSTCNVNEYICPGSYWFSLNVFAKDGQVPEAFKQGLLELKRVQQHGFLPSELEQVKREFFSNYEKQAREVNHRTTRKIMDYYVNYLSGGYPVPDRLQDIELCKALLEQITLDEINQWVHQLITNRGVTITSTTPPGEKSIVTEEALRTVMKEVEEAKLAPYQSSYVHRPLLRNPTHPGKILSTHYHEKTGITEHHLENGMRVFIKPSKETKDSVSFSACSFGGEQSSPFTLKKIAQLAQSLFAWSGKGGFTHGELSQYLKGKQVSIQASLTNYTSQLNGSSSISDIDTMFQLINSVFTDPAYSKTTFETVQKMWTNYLLHEKKDPNVIFHQTLNRLWTQDHPAFRPLLISDVENSEYESILKFLKAQYANPANFDLFIVGNIEPKQIQVYLEKYLAGIPKNGPRQTAFGYPLLEFPQKIVTEKVDGPLQSSSKTHFVFYSLLEDTQEDRLFANYTVNLVRKRLVNVLRFEEGKSYSPRSFLMETPFPGFHKHSPSTVDITVGSSPKYIEEVKAKTLQEIKKMQEEGFTKEELVTVKALIAEDLRKRWNYDSSWIDAMKKGVSWGVNLNEIAEVEKRFLEKFTLADAQKMIKRLYPLDRYVQLTQNPKQVSSEEKKQA